jgi:putative thiamine transport system substrate-binding protein
MCRFHVLAALVAVIFGTVPDRAAADAFAPVREAARGQTVYFNAWGGSTQINDYIAWVAAEVAERHGIDLVHVKLTDTGEAVARVLAEKTAGQVSDGSVDLVWINGENFLAMKANDLLFGPFAFDLPNFALVDTAGKPTTLVDFAVPTDGYESPWGMAQFVMIHDAAALPEPPASLDALGDWVRVHPGRFTFPSPPDFIGATFLKHVLHRAVADPELLASPPGDDAEAVLAPVWAWLDDLQPHLWRGGQAFPASGPQLHQLFEDGEVALTMAFNPAEASSLVLDGRFPATTRSYAFADGSIGNTHFVAIPFNSNATEAARVVADFLLSPEAQARKQDPAHWGDFTVLDLDRLDAADRARFAAIELHPATLPPDRLGRTLPEPHGAWMGLIEDGWRQRFGS